VCIFPIILISSYVPFRICPYEDYCSNLLVVVTVLSTPGLSTPHISQQVIW